MQRSAVLGIALLAILCGTPAEAQQAGKMYRVGILSGRTLATDGRLVNAFRRTLSGLGYKDGKNLEIIYRGADENFKQLPELASDLVRTKLDAIVAAGTRATVALQRATQSVPIVMTENENPVALGFVASLARPGGNITGTTDIDLSSKNLQLLTELVPRLRRVAVVRDSSFREELAGLRAVQSKARTIGIQAVAVDIRSPNQVDAALKTIPNLHADAILVFGDAVTDSRAARIVRLVAAQRVPAAYTSDMFTAVGGLMSYAAPETGYWSQAASYVDRILKGAKPADLPVERPTTFELVVNLKTARSLGITVPQSILLRADRVIK